MYIEGNIRLDPTAGERAAHDNCLPDRFFKTIEFADGETHRQQVGWSWYPNPMAGTGWPECAFCGEPTQ